ncbi:uncharacterized protein LOC117775234 isoform X8 [Hippoglossus hippoglossus]|uniref:uncharacterized protein LOC117775234 isoform X8 n=1 Tax=Hippoglossus hippoglossus TaxID=8267 RepID=UPI00148C4CD9|nr:uncharacterized protein LOC117775234 isoform X8 [Hippoglossus hippoglossus]
MSAPPLVLLHFISHIPWHVELGSSGRGYRYGAMAADTGGPSVTYDICLCGLSFPLGTPCNSGPWADGAISSHQAGPLTPCGLLAPWGGTGGIVFSSSEQTAV